MIVQHAWSPLTPDGVTAIAPLLRCDRSIEGHSVVLRLAGEIDLASKPDLDGWLCSAQATARPVILDMSGVTFMGSSGLTSLLVAHRRGPLRLRGLTPRSRRCLEITGLDAELRIDIEHADE